VVALCITTAAASCGRAGLDAAITHALERAAALTTRQRVIVQRDRTIGVYFRIVATGPRDGVCICESYDCRGECCGVGMCTCSMVPGPGQPA
jgi:hypothetical protein